MYVLDTVSVVLWPRRLRPSQEPVRFWVNRMEDRDAFDGPPSAEVRALVDRLAGASADPDAARTQLADMAEGFALYAGDAEVPGLSRTHFLTVAHEAGFEAFDSTYGELIENPADWADMQTWANIASKDLRRLARTLVGEVAAAHGYTSTGRATGAFRAAHGQHYLLAQVDVDTHLGRQTVLVRGSQLSKIDRATYFANHPDLDVECAPDPPTVVNDPVTLAVGRELGLFWDLPRNAWYFDPVAADLPPGTMTRHNLTRWVARSDLHDQLREGVKGLLSALERLG